MRNTLIKRKRRIQKAEIRKMNRRLISAGLVDEDNPVVMIIPAGKKYENYIKAQQAFEAFKKIKSEKARRRSNGELFVGDRLDDGSYVAKICYTHEES